MENAFQNLSFRYKIWLENSDGEGILGDGKYRLLKAVEETGSLKLAIEQLGLSYRKTWDNLERIEQQLGFDLLQRQRGGAAGGRSGLTDEGKRLLEIFEAFYRDFDPIFKEHLALLDNLMHTK
ncbi:MAG TPA: LysR family transcriptional regulator [Bacteroidales bacterium]|nr:LysR family transcriptional regulator [Bacteroidales bacterium]HOE03797.1 LysR family transcriptional regulator [Bacteroidales bacterium]HQL69553.1 LysR family transcriptional regulator [Bacteroidales bacterium]